jgi:uncharacterized protein (TIGR00369 family)
MDKDFEAMAAAIESSGVQATLGIKVGSISAERVVLSMPVGPAVHQPAGLLHGGVSALLAETAASIGSGAAAPPGKMIVGIELSASHLRGMTEGILTADATPIRLGRSVHVWHISLTDQDGRLICDAKCTVAVMDQPIG